MGRYLVCETVLVLLDYKGRQIANITKDRRHIHNITNINLGQKPLLPMMAVSKCPYETDDLTKLINIARDKYYD